MNHFPLVASLSNLTRANIWETASKAFDHTNTAFSRSISAVRSNARNMPEYLSDNVSSKSISDFIVSIIESSRVKTVVSLGKSISSTAKAILSKGTAPWMIGCIATAATIYLPISHYQKRKDSQTAELVQLKKGTDIELEQLDNPYQHVDAEQVARTLKDIRSKIKILEKKSATHKARGTRLRKRLFDYAIAFAVPAISAPVSIVAPLTLVSIISRVCVDILTQRNELKFTEAERLLLDQLRGKAQALEDAITVIQQDIDNSSAKLRNFKDLISCIKQNSNASRSKPLKMSIHVAGKSAFNESHIERVGNNIYRFPLVVSEGDQCQLTISNAIGKGTTTAITDGNTTYQLFELKELESSSEDKDLNNAALQLYPGKHTVTIHAYKDKTIAILLETQEGTGNF